MGFVIINSVLSCLHKAYAPHTCCQSVKIPYLHDIVVEAHNPDIGMLSGEKNKHWLAIEMLDLTKIHGLH